MEIVFVSALIGTFLGYLLSRRKAERDNLWWSIIGGVIGMLLGMCILCEIDNAYHPISTNELTQDNNNYQDDGWWIQLG